ncbi:MAG TPA: RidA family protein [Candidatus Limnocylindrales bacterium]|nr:RidA family protein [Candidatus Limnocylindrales bacterium]
MTKGRTSHHPPDLFDARRYGFAQAVSVPAGRLVFVSGQVAWDADERLIATDLAGQATAALANLDHALAAAGAGMGDVTALRIYIVGDPPDTSGVSAALRASFPAGEGPAATWIRVGGLEGDGLLVEIEATAVVP